MPASWDVESYRGLGRSRTPTVSGFTKARDFGGKPRFFGMGLLSFGDRITRFLAFWVEIASLRPPVGGRAGCIGRIEGTIHPAEPPQAGGGPRSRNHGPLRNVPTAVPGWRWPRTPCRLAPAARVASDAAAGADGCSPDHARAPHTGGSIRGDVRDVPARCRISNSAGGRGRRTCTGRPDARTDSNRRADPQDTSAISATRGHPDSQSPEIRQKPARRAGASSPCLPVRAYQLIRAMATAWRSTGLQAPAAMPGSAQALGTDPFRASPPSRRRSPKRAAGTNGRIGATTVLSGQAT